MNKKFLIVNQTKKKINIKYITICLDYLNKIFNNKKKIELTFVGEKEIKKLNKKFLNRNSITNVLSFPYFEKNFLGEIIINPFYKDIKNINDILRLVIHSFLHLQGLDHNINTDFYQRENKILKQVKKEIKKGVK